MSGYGRTALRDEERRVRAARPGQRNEFLVRAAYRCGQLCPHELGEIEVEEVLTDAAVACGLPVDEAIRTIRSGLLAGQEKPRYPDRPIADRDEALAVLDCHDHATRDLPFPGRLGTLDWVVHRGLIVLAYESGGPGDIPAGLRRLAAEIGVDPTRVGQGLQDLVERGLIAKTKWSRQGRPAHYSLLLPQPTASLSPSRTTAPSSSSPPDESTHNLIGQGRTREREITTRLIRHDAFRNGALGELGARIVDRLGRHPGDHTQAEVAKALGTTAGTINRHVGPDRPLVAYGLITRTASGSVSCNGWPDIALLDRIAVDLGTRGRHAALLDQIRRDYRDRGLLDRDGYWLDPDTGERQEKATWL